eukprot:PLAT14797.1.p1 GENE.PLAT14797.1~~PLAT14797.1.p1  ORF type:complete len:593 (+),score=222.33 PLAT14797.1:12-1790(+)
MEREERRWQALVRASSHARKRHYIPHIDLEEHPFCEERQLTDQRQLQQLNRNPFGYGHVADRAVGVSSPKHSTLPKRVADELHATLPEKTVDYRTLTLRQLLTAPVRLSASGAAAGGTIAADSGIVLPLPSSAPLRSTLHRARSTGSMAPPQLLRRRRRRRRKAPRISTAASSASRKTSTAEAAPLTEKRVRVLNPHTGRLSPLSTRGGSSGERKRAASRRGAAAAAMAMDTKPAAGAAGLLTAGELKALLRPSIGASRAAVATTVSGAAVAADVDRDAAPPPKRSEAVWNNTTVLPGEFDPSMPRLAHLDRGAAARGQATVGPVAARKSQLAAAVARSSRSGLRRRRKRGGRGAAGAGGSDAEGRRRAAKQARRLRRKKARVQKRARAAAAAAAREKAWDGSLHHMPRIKRLLQHSKSEMTTMERIEAHRRQASGRVVGPITGEREQQDHEDRALNMMIPYVERTERAYLRDCAHHRSTTPRRLREGGGLGEAMVRILLETRGLRVEDATDSEDDEEEEEEDDDAFYEDEDEHDERMGSPLPRVLWRADDADASDDDSDDDSEEEEEERREEDAPYSLSPSRMPPPRLHDF